MRASIPLRRAALALLLAALSTLPLVAGAAAVVDTDNPQAIRGATRVAIQRFGVEFYSQLYAEGRGSRSNAAMTAELKGIDDATRQAIAEQAYLDTLQALKDAGFELVELPQLAAQPGFQALDAQYGKPSPWRVEDEKLIEGGKQVSHVVAPAPRRAYWQSAIARGDFGQRAEAQNQKVGQLDGELAKALGATLLDVHLLASFGTTSASKNSLLSNIARSGAKAAIDVKPVLLPEETQIQIVNAEGARTFSGAKRRGHTGAVYLKEPLVAETALFETRDTQTDAEKSKAAGVDMLIGLIGGSSSSAGFVDVTPSSAAAYRDTYGALIRDAVVAMVAALKGAK